MSSLKYCKNYNEVLENWMLYIKTCIFKSSFKYAYSSALGLFKWYYYIMAETEYTKRKQWIQKKIEKNCAMGLRKNK